ncbi:hypothetical protein M9H77_02613 [Catharanthus roseus]|uniref:Uncharacterized protein n=1 Tax=Catharanthus roseus TaxID=4058 RepID=A0ACC0C9E4_CATRO|nr:hypothetical protein M9H77_02613 [Catharanthus roseus]
MEFVDKIQAISAVQKWSIRIERKFKVVQKKSNPWLLRDNQIHQRTHMPCLGYSTSKFISKLISASCCKRSGDPCLKRYPRSPSITPDGLYVKKAWYDRKFAIKLKSGDHTITPYNQRTGIYMVKSPVRLDGRSNNVYTLKMNEKSCSCGKWQVYMFSYSSSL